jgi:hypothetical protein
MIPDPFQDRPFRCLQIQGFECLESFVGEPENTGGMNIQAGWKCRTDNLSHRMKVITSNPLKQRSLTAVKKRVSIRYLRYILPSFFGLQAEKLQHKTRNRSCSEGYQDPGTHANCIFKCLWNRVTECIFDRKAYSHSGASPVKPF